MATFHLANCRHIKLATTEETTTKFSFLFSRHLSSVSHFEDFSSSKVGPMHGVSHQLVPAGPNPLHN
ncbi:unnamed protein product [Ilex paraguariensis]|uniref:Uncharacterized protein n=1 Tax=Ilex paraguariensis TaxID=185542 RepID=A0ABC8SVA3_9AQUA